MINMNKNIVIAIIIALTSIASITAYAQVVSTIPDKADIDKTISTTDTRKSFGYCPIELEKNLLDGYGLTYTIESCPISRIYIDNWDKLDEKSREEIVTYLLSKGYRMETD